MERGRVPEPIKDRGYEDGRPAHLVPLPRASALRFCAIICAMPQNTPARRRFRVLIRRPESQIDLAEAALCIAWEDQGVGDPRAALRELNAIAERAKPRITGLTRPPNIVGALNGY